MTEPAGGVQRPRHDKEKTMLELYHGTTSVCAQNARLTLAENDF